LMAFSVLHRHSSSGVSSWMGFDSFSLAPNLRLSYSRLHPWLAGACVAARA
jgi:hypothetical protein